MTLKPFAHVAGKRHLLLSYKSEVVGRVEWEELSGPVWGIFFSVLVGLDSEPPSSSFALTTFDCR